MVLLKIVLMSLILVGMVILLLSVKAMGNPWTLSDRHETDRMRKDIKEEESPITPRSVFNDFLARDTKK